MANRLQIRCGMKPMIIVCKIIRNSHEHQTDNAHVHLHTHTHTHTHRPVTFCQFLNKTSSSKRQVFTCRFSNHWRKGVKCVERKSKLRQYFRCLVCGQCRNLCLTRTLNLFYKGQQLRDARRVFQKHKGQGLTELKI